MDYLLKYVTILEIIFVVSLSSSIQKTNGISLQNEPITDLEKRVCTEKECTDIANQFLSNMDTTVDPCENFYKFTCGNYIKNSQIPDDQTKVSQMTVLVNLVKLQLRKILEEAPNDDEPKHFKNLKKYYKACMNNEVIEEIGLKNVKKILEDLGGWPVVNDTKPDTKWTSVLYGLTKLGLSTNYIYYVIEDMDFVDSRKRVLAFNTAEYRIKQAYLIQGKNNSAVKAYYKLMVDVAKLFGAEEEKAKVDMEEALDFEISLAKSAKTEEQFRADLLDLYNLYTIPKLESDYPEFPWRELIENYLPKNRTLPNNYSIILTEPDYTRALITLLKDTPEKIIRNYLIWRGILDLTPYLNMEMRASYQTFRQAVTGQSKQLERWKECLGKINSNLLLIESAIYVRKYFDQHSKTLASELIDYIKEEFSNILNATNWGDEDKINAIKKINALYAHVAFPYELLDDKNLDEIYGTVEVDEDNYLKSTLALNKLDIELGFEKLFKPVNKTDWRDYSQSAVVNAYYKADSNAIILPAAILQGVYFNAKRPRYVNFASIGSVIGHEMSHGFDDVGHQFDKNGDLKNWWSDVAERDFTEKKDCIINQFNQYDFFGIHLNGALTVGENLADFGGQKTAYYSYQKWAKENGEEPGLPNMNYTNNQIFWIASATIWCSSERPESIKNKIATDEHPPDEFRVNGALQNLEIFAKDYKCPVGSKMNPEKKCKPCNVHKIRWYPDNNENSDLCLYELPYTQQNNKNTSPSFGAMCFTA